MPYPHGLGHRRQEPDSGHKKESEADPNAKAEMEQRPKSHLPADAVKGRLTKERNPGSLIKKKSRTGMLAIGTLAFLMYSCDTFKAHPDAARSDEVAREIVRGPDGKLKFAHSDAASNDEAAPLIEKHKDAPIGRYQMLSADKAIVKLDTATGDTWMLNNSHWHHLPTEPVQEWTRDAPGSPVREPSTCTPTLQDPCTNVWLYKDPAHLRGVSPVGTVDGGYRFKGGNANSIANWESAPGVPPSNPFRR